MQGVQAVDFKLIATIRWETHPNYAFSRIASAAVITDQGFQSK
jgi:hypothetical protein